MKNNNFIQRSIIGALAFLKDLIFAEELAARRGFLQSLDPRIKLATFLLFIIQVLLARNLQVIFFLYALCLLLVLISRINLLFFLKRTWFFIPLFSLFIAIPAILSFGLSSVLPFLMRVLTCVSFTVLLSITTKHFALLRVLRIFKIPQIFVMTLGMCYRYIYLFVEIIEQTYLAVKSRVGTFVHYKNGRSIAAWNIASLWQRSVKLNDEVYKAMLSRGYRGEAMVWNDFKFRPRDWLWLLVVLIMFVTVSLRGAVGDEAIFY
ncbi:MAG: energy-coupling factor transporter transmembrane component T [Candidatus Omnitrophica bacterium]|nr:energy-coupling factor transporter transmembrane component T [Candidatus Omnitrophota bacterium]